MMRQGLGDYVQNFMPICREIKIFIFFFFFLGGGGGLGGEGLDCSQYQILTDPRNGLRNPNMNFGNDRSHRLGGV